MYKQRPRFCKFVFIKKAALFLELGGLSIQPITMCMLLFVATVADLSFPHSFMQIAGEPNSLTADGKYAYVTMTAFKGGTRINTIAACDRSLNKCSTKLSVASFREDLVAWQIQKVDGKYYILLGSNVVDSQPEYYFLVCSDPELRKDSCKFSHKKSAITNGVKKGLEFAAFTYDQKTKDFLITASENGSITFDRRKQRVIRVNKITNKQSIVDFSQYGFDPETNWWPAEYISSIN